MGELDAIVKTEFLGNEKIDLSSDVVKGVLKENLESMLAAVNKCTCPSSECEIPKEMHDFLKQCMLVGQGQKDEKRVRAVSFCFDSDVKAVVYRQKPPKLRSRKEPQDEETDHAYCSGDSDDGAIVNRTQINDLNYYVRKGYLIIFNNIWFDNYAPTRNGAGEEATKMKSVFDNLGFTTEIYSNTPTHEMVEILEVLAKSDALESYDCFVCLIMSHGSNEGVHGSDGKPYKIDNITTMFKGDTCKAAIGKPKIFLFQSCRGEKIDKGQKYYARGKANQEDIVRDGGKKPNVYTVPTASDIVMVCSTTEDMVSNRTLSISKTEKSCKSWFITALEDVISKYADKEDLMTMLTRVNNSVAQKHEGFSSMQVSCVFSTLTKKVFLR